MAVGYQAPAARAQVVMRIPVVDRESPIQVEGELFVQLVLVGDGVHVGRALARYERIVVVLAARIARRLPRVGPSEAEAAFFADLLGGGDPFPIAAAFVLKRQVVRDASR